MGNSIINNDFLIDNLVYTVVTAIEDYPEKCFFIDSPLKHTFTKGLYSREIKMPKNAIIISEKHLFEHQFVISEGVVSVWTQDEGWVTLMAPYHGITKAGTQRVLITALDTVWTTFHPNPKGFTTADEIYDDIIEKRDNDFLGGRFKNNVFIPSNEELKKIN